MPARPKSLTLPRRSKVVEHFDLEMVQSTENYAWKRRYRQSLSDMDLATQLAAHMSEDLRKSFLAHNNAELEETLKAMPRAPTPAYNEMPESMPESTLFGAAIAWQELDFNACTPSRLQSEPIQELEPHELPTTFELQTTPTNSISKDTRRRKGLLRSVKGFLLRFRKSATQ